MWGRREAEGERRESACQRGGGAGAAEGEKPGWGGGQESGPGAPSGCAQSCGDPGLNAA